MATEFTQYRIRLNSVIPGLIETRFHEQFSTSEPKAAAARQTSPGRNRTAPGIAKAILFLAGEPAGFITEKYIDINGSLYMRA